MILNDDMITASWWPRLILGTIVAAVTLPCFRFLFHWVQRHITFRSAQNMHGCQKPASYPHTNWLGLDLLRERQAASHAGRQMAHYDEWFAKLGHTWEETLAGQRLINTIDTTNIQYTLTSDIEVFGRAGAFHKNDFLGPGIFSSDGPRWRFSRDIIKPLFTKAELSDTTMLQKHVDRLIACLPGDGSTVDVQPLIKKMNFDSASEFVFGESTNSLLPDSPYSNGDFIEAFNYANAGSLKRRKAGALAFQYYFDREYPKSIAKVYQFVDWHVQRVLGKSVNSNDKSKGQYVLLEELAKEIKDPIALRYECINLFAPGRDGVAILISNAIFRLARNPRMWQELRNMALALGEEPELNFETLKSLKPFRDVVYETLRSTGPSARVVRTAFKDTILPRGGGPDGEAPVFVKKGDQVGIIVWGCNHKKDVWGEDSYEFKPDRWSRHKSPWEFVPFGGGRRICPANQQALIQAIYVLIRLTRTFESIENRDPVEEYVELQRNLTESRHGVKIGLNPAKEQSGL